MKTRPSMWAIIVTFQDGEQRYYGGLTNVREWTKARGSAARYESEIDARYHAYRLKESYDRIADFTIEEIKNPRAIF